MKIETLFSRRAMLLALGILLLGAFVFVVARTGPFAPTRVTVVTIGEGAVWHRHRRGAPFLPDRPDRRRPRAACDGRRRRGGQGRPAPRRDGPGGPRPTRGCARSLDRPRRQRRRRGAAARREVAASNARRYADLGERKFVSPSVVESKLQELTSAEAALAVIRILNRMARQYQTAVIVVTHDEKSIPAFKRIYRIRDGKTHEEAGEGRAV